MAKIMRSASVVDLFCGIGGMTHGFVLEGFHVLAGLDADPSCRYAYLANNPSVQFVETDLQHKAAAEIACLYPQEHIKILVGCAPCQPFSRYTRRYAKANKKDEKWELVRVFGNLIKEIQPEIVSMENVPELERHEVFKNLVRMLESAGYFVWHDVVRCQEYGIPQTRRRLVLLASLFGKIGLIPSTHENPKTVADTIRHLPPLSAGEQNAVDPVHRTSGLSELNLRRIRHTREGGSWRDWPKDLQLKCHKKKTGRTYPSIYGRMRWNRPSPTITTEFHALGSGRFGHPEQDRAISLREGALLQTFPENYRFVDSEEFSIGTIARHIGNAVPVQLGRVISRSISEHLRSQGID